MASSSSSSSGGIGFCGLLAIVSRSMPMRHATRSECAALFSVPDIFEVNTAMTHAPDAQRAAWERCRAKLVESAGLTITLTIPSEICDEGGDIIPGAVYEPDLSKCPRCGGPADNGHDREFPPNPYFCTKCSK